MSEALSQFHFLRPLWLLALVPLVGLLIWLQRRHGSTAAWRRLCDPLLLEQLLVLSPTGQRRYWPGLLALGWLLAVLALAGPSWEKRPLPLYQNQAGRVLVLDLSQAMLATDLQPSRLARARFKISDLLARDDTRTGLVVYAGDAFTVVPLTRDAATIDHLLPVLAPDLMPVSGNRPERGLTLAGRLLAQAGVQHGQIILVAAQADTAAVTAAARLHRQGQQVAVLAVGTPAGAPVPDGKGGFLTAPNGQVRLAQLDRAGLQAVAAAGGGRYVELGVDDSDVRTLVAERPTPRAGPAETHGSSGWLERGPWLVLALLPLAAAAFRRGWLLLLALLLVPLPRPAAAWDWSALWLRADQRAYQALQNDQPAQAAALAHDPWLRGTAAYRAGDYAAAADAFAQVDGATGAYNRGNALAQLGRYRAALSAYDQALAADPRMTTARDNRALVEKLLRRQQARQRQAASAPPAPSALPDEASRHAGRNPSRVHPEPNANTADRGRHHASSRPAERAEPAAPAGAGGDHTAPAGDRLTQEQQQILQQWLRRIPDDPGGLLRREFREQYERRQAAAGRAAPW